MRIKSIFYSVCITSLLFVPNIFAANAVINGPDKVKPKEIIIITSMGSEGDYIFPIIDPKLDETQSITCDTNGVISVALTIKAPGEYYFYIVATDQDSHSISRHKVLVEGSLPPKPDSPDTPDTPDEPDTPLDIPGDEFNNIDQRVYEWTKQKSLNKYSAFLP